MGSGVGSGEIVGSGVGMKHDADAAGEPVPSGQAKHDVDLPRGEYCPPGHDAQAAPV